MGIMPPPSTPHTEPPTYAVDQSYSFSLLHATFSWLAVRTLVFLAKKWKKLILSHFRQKSVGGGGGDGGGK